MKCIKSIRPSKNVEVGEIKRINDVEAEIRVRGGNWVYIPKNEWKTSTRKQKESVNDQITDSVTQQKVKNKKKI